MKLAFYEFVNLHVAGSGERMSGKQYQSKVITPLPLLPFTTMTYVAVHGPPKDFNIQYRYFIYKDDKKASKYCIVIQFRAVKSVKSVDH